MFHASRKKVVFFLPSLLSAPYLPVSKNERLPAACEVTSTCLCKEYFRLLPQFVTSIKMSPTNYQA